MTNKIYKTIGEVSKELSINTHTLRFWEKEFRQLKPKYISGKRRFYSENDIKILKLIFELLKNQGYTIIGAKKLLNMSPNKLDGHFKSGVKDKKFKSVVKIKAEKIKEILKRIKKDI